jgi:hypothetical protein
MEKLLLTLTSFALISITGCVSVEELRHDENMYDKHVAAVKAAVPVPIFQMTAQPGKDIELKGVHQVTVYNPADATNKPPEAKLRPNAAQTFWSGITGMTKAGGEIAVPLFSLWTGLLGKGIDASKGAGDTEVIKEGFKSLYIYRSDKP